MRMLQLGSDLYLSPEPVAVHAGGKLRRQDLDHHPATEDAVDRHENATHAATCQLSIELIVGGQRGLELIGEVGHRVRCKEMRILNPACAFGTSNALDITSSGVPRVRQLRVDLPIGHNQ